MTTGLSVAQNSTRDTNQNTVQESEEEKKERSELKQCRAHHPTWSLLNCFSSSSRATVRGTVTSP